MKRVLETYVNKRIYELSNNKNNVLDKLQLVDKSITELDITDKKNILEMKQKFYLISGALAELEEIKRIFNISE